MPGIGLNTEIHYFDDLYRHYPTILSDNGSDTDPILTAGSDGK